MRATGLGAVEDGASTNSRELVREVLVKPIPEQLLLKTVSEAVADKGIEQSMGGE